MHPNTIVLIGSTLMLAAFAYLLLAGQAGAADKNFPQCCTAIYGSSGCTPMKECVAQATTGHITVPNHPLPPNSSNGEWASVCVMDIGYPCEVMAVDEDPLTAAHALCHEHELANVRLLSNPTKPLYATGWQKDCEAVAVKYARREADEERKAREAFKAKEKADLAFVHKVAVGP